MKWGSQKKSIALGLLVLAVTLPFIAAATTANLPRFGVTVNFPTTLDVFTRDMAQDDPVLKLYGLTADEARSQLDSEGLDVMAVDIAGTFTLTLQVRTDDRTLADMDAQTLTALAAAYKGQAYELFTARGNPYILIKADNGVDLACVFLGGGMRYELMLNANHRLSASMVSLLKGIAANTDFDLGQ